MRNSFRNEPLLIGSALLLAVGLASAQETAKPVQNQGQAARLSSIYRLEFVVREREGNRQVNSRNYSLSASATGREWARIRVGSLVPTGEFQSEGGAKGPQYQNSGISIDCRLEERETDVLLNVIFESSAVVGQEKLAQERGGLPPIIRQVRFEGAALVSPGKPTVIATLDDVATDRRYEIEVTVTKVK
jgi:hypothetical protein